MTGNVLCSFIFVLCTFDFWKFWYRSISSAHCMITISDPLGQTTRGIHSSLIECWWWARWGTSSASKHTHEVLECLKQCCTDFYYGTTGHQHGLNYSHNVCSAWFNV